MTAVEWLVQRLAENGIIHSSDISKAKEIEKQQIIEAYDKGYDRGDDADLCEPIQYYNETYKSE